MELKKKRTETNNLFTSGPLIVNGEVVANYSLEHTPSMIPTGIYQVTLLNDPAHRRRQIAIVADDYTPSELNPYIIATFISGNSYRNVIGKTDIVLGEKNIPGAVILSHKVFERFFERIEKCVARGERITLYVTDHMMRHTEAPPYWLEDSMHGCPSSNRQVEVDDIS